MSDVNKSKTSKEVKKRYEDKAYKKCLVRLRHDTDEELIQYIAEEQEHGRQTTEIIRELCNIGLKEIKDPWR